MNFEIEAKDKVGLIGDIHAEDRLLEKSIEFFTTQKIEKILCTGDIVDRYGDVNRTCEIIRNHDVMCVKGNHDRWCLENDVRDLTLATKLNDIDEINRLFLSQLPKTVLFESPIGGFHLCHGIKDNDMIKIKPDVGAYDVENTIELQEMFNNPEISYLIGGHTHVPMCKKFASLTIINPGTLFRKHDPGVAILDFEDCNVRFWKFEVQTVPDRFSQLIFDKTESLN